MTAAQLELADDLDEEEDLGPSLAMPPLYVLRTAERCPECGMANTSIPSAAPPSMRRRTPTRSKQFHFLRLIRSVPEVITAVLKKKCPSYFRRPGGQDRTRRI